MDGLSPGVSSEVSQEVLARDGSGMRRKPDRLAHCSGGVLSCGDWKNGFSKEARELRSGKPGSGPGLPVEAERRIEQMIKLLVELPLIGKFTIIIVWHRKGSR